MVHVCEFDHRHAPIGHWVADWTRVCHDYSDANAVIRTHRPHLQFKLRDVLGYQLNEMNFRDMVARIDPNFLKQGVRARALRGLRLQQMDNDTMIFYVTSSEIDLNGIEYMNLIRFMDWDDIASDQDSLPRERALRLLNESDIQVHCDDPSFLYWGYQFICTQLQASVYEEDRPPHTNNPGMRGIVCKHLNRVLRSLPFYNGDIAKVIRQQWGGKAEKRVDQEIQQRESLQQQANALPPDQVEEEPAPLPFDMNQLNAGAVPPTTEPADQQMDVDAPAVPQSDNAAIRPRRASADASKRTARQSSPPRSSSLPS